MTNYSRHTNPKLIVPLIIILVLCACEKDMHINDDKNTYYDDIADITFLDEYFFTTNYDLSGNAGSQIDLLKYNAESNNAFIIDNFDLEMNGQGYLAITNDGSDIFLQSRTTQLIIRTSAIGQRAFLTSDDIDELWQPSGISYNKDTDSLLVLYRNMANLKQYRLRSISKNITTDASRDDLFEINSIDTTYHGVYSMEYHDSTFYMLGVDSTQMDVLLVYNHDLNLLNTEQLYDSTIVGLCFKENDLYFSHRDKRIEFWESY